MSTISTPSSTDILRSLRLLRSTEPLERARGISILGHVTDDPRIQQVFEHLYESDPDPRVRHAAWQALHQSGPAVPAPGPVTVSRSVTAPQPVTPPERPSTPVRPNSSNESEAAMGTSGRKSNPAGRKSAPRRQSSPRRRSSRGRSSSGTSTFLFDPSNIHIISEEREQRTKQKRSGRAALWMAVLSLLVMLLLGSLVWSDMRDWNRLRDGETGYAAITELSADKVVYTFEVTAEDGTTEAYEGNQAITATGYDDLVILQEAGDPVEITYWPDDPNVSETLEDNPDHDQRDRLAVATLVMIIVALLFVSLGMVQRQIGRKPLQVLPGQVVECTGQADADGDFKFKLRYAFKSPRTDQVITAQRTAIRNDLRGQPLPAPGTRVAVHYRSDRNYTLL